MTTSMTEATTTGRPCRACKGAGGFNTFVEMPTGGTGTITVHRWIECSLCKGTGEEIRHE